MQAQLDVFGYIGKRYSYTEDKMVGTTCEDVQKFLSSNATCSKLIVNINTTGGSTFEGIGIHSLLRQFSTLKKASDPAFVVQTVNLAAALSAGSIIYLAGDERVSLIGSQLMIHCCHGEVYGNADDLRQMAKSYDVTDTAVAEMYSACGQKKSAKDYIEMMRAESWFTAESSMELGLTTEVDSGREAPKMEMPFERGSYKKYITSLMTTAKSSKERNSSSEDNSKKLEEAVTSAEKRRKEFLFQQELLRLASA